MPKLTTLEEDLRSIGIFTERVEDKLLQAREKLARVQKTIGFHMRTGKNPPRSVADKHIELLSKIRKYNDKIARKSK